ncbi:MAG TPA: folylpolyglutamate synthase/dihydrofolate synthase family protein [Vicinamibacterales bacterium]
MTVAPPSSPRAYLSSLELFGIKLGLDQIRGLVAGLGHPDRTFRSVIVAGTNGKGSVTAMIERAVRAGGYRTGRYISPHLVRLEERFVVDGREVAASEVDGAIEAVRGAAALLPFPPSFFEATTAIAFEVFRRQRVEVAVLEVGLGGRLDATNVVSPIGAIITAIDLDHEQYLGTSLEAIAAEKAGVIKAGRLVVLGRNPAAVQGVVRSTAASVAAPLIYAPDDVALDAALVNGRTTATIVTPRGRYDGVRLALRGRHQLDNAVTAVRFLEAISETQAISIPAEAIRAGLEEAEWPARLEIRSWRGAEIVIDGAHNPAGARALVEYLRETYGRRLPMVVGAMRDKAIDALVDALAGSASRFVFTAVDSPRAAPAADLAAVAARVVPHVPAVAGGAPMAALATALESPGPIVVAGSLYLCGEILSGIS